ncbi:MAG: sugar transferase [Clostridia bacterium]|nr:sugar transferase [Clostridia bacterium]
MYIGFKRVLDIVLSLLLLVVLAPVLAIVALIIHIDSDGPVIFRQVRSGRNGRLFVIYKFRTMLTAAPANIATAQLQLPHRYITPVGRFLRQTSLDELPQLFNVLKGDMSFVGPRPVIPTEQYLLRLRRRYGADAVRPGITGLAQIRGRDELAPRIKAQYDAEYAANCTWLLDCYIFVSTLRYVLRREGIREGSADLYRKP